MTDSILSPEDSMDPSALESELSKRLWARPSQSREHRNTRHGSDVGEIEGMLEGEKDGAAVIKGVGGVLGEMV